MGNRGRRIDSKNGQTHKKGCIKSLTSLAVEVLYSDHEVATLRLDDAWAYKEDIMEEWNGYKQTCMRWSVLFRNYEHCLYVRCTCE